MAQYIDITDVILPSGAVPGQRVAVKVVMKNIYTAIYDAAVVCRLTPDGQVESYFFSFPAGGTVTVSLYFIAPSTENMVVVKASYKGTDGAYHQGDEFTLMWSIGEAADISLVASSIPAQAAPGSSVTITADVKNLSTVSLPVRVAIIYNNIDIVVSPGDISVAAGATQRFTGVFTMPSTDAAVGIFAFYQVSGAWHAGPVAVGTVALTGSTTTPVFSLTKPTASPQSGPPGNVAISCPVTISNASIAVAFQVKCIVYEGSVWPGAGTKLWEQTQDVVLGNGTHAVQFTHPSTEGTIDRRDVGVEIYYSGVKVEDDQWDDVFYVTAGAPTTPEFSLSTPTADPFSALPGTVTITCPITVSNAPTPVSFQLKCIVYEGSELPGAGTKLWEETADLSLADGMYERQFTRTSTTGSIDRRDVGVEVYYGGVKVEDDQWDDIYYVTSGYELVKKTIYDAAATFNGTAEVATAMVNIPAAMFGIFTLWAVDHAADDMKEEVEKQGGTMLELEIWQKGISQWMIVATAHSGSAASLQLGVVPQFAFLVWLAIIAGALLIGAIVGYFLVLSPIKTILYGTGGGNGDGEGGVAGIASLIGPLMIVMMMAMMMEMMGPMLAEPGAPPKPKPVTEAVVKGAKTVGKGIKYVAEKAVPVVGEAIKKMTTKEE